MLPILSPKKLDLNKLLEVQERIARAVEQRDGFKKLERIAGCDISFASGGRAFAACTVLDYHTLESIEENVVEVKLKFPYIPTFLAFREVEGLLKAVDEMRADVYMVGGHGLAHPRRAGLACHLGVMLNKPTLGVAKSKLIGRAREPASTRGSHSPLLDGDELVGAVVRSRAGSKPVYVSVGHKISLKSAIEVALATTTVHRLPEPLFQAHAIATKEMKRAVG